MATFSRISSIPAHDSRRLPTVIGRPRYYETQEIDTQQLLNELSATLNAEGLSCRIIYVPPNYIIDAGTLPLQQQLLLSSPLQTRNYTLDMVAWSKEDEAAQLPWLIDDAQDDSSIAIDPLLILPSISKKNSFVGIALHILTNFTLSPTEKKKEDLTCYLQPGTPKLKDNFVRMLDANYDVKAPDFSYVMINEIKEYYLMRHSFIVLCKQALIDMVSSLQEFLPRLSAAVERIKSSAVSYIVPKANNKRTDFTLSIGYIDSAVADATDWVAQIDNIVHPMYQICDLPLQLSLHRDIYPISEVPLPPGYGQRLLQIHTIVTQHVYKAKGDVVTTKCPDGGFEAYVAIGDYIHRYNNSPMKTAATAATTAAYQSLRYITNVLGFKIVDPNYPTLATLVSAIHKDNSAILSLQSSINTIIGHSQATFETFTDLSHNILANLPDVAENPNFCSAIHHLTSIVAQHHAAATAAFHDFMAHKEKYLTTRLSTESPTTKPSRWVQVHQLPVLDNH